jgi:signal transduction histidine kinase
MADVDGNPLLYEAYYVVDRVDAAARRDYWAIIPLALVTIFGLYLVQAPLVFRLARGVDTAHRRRRGRLRLAASRGDLDRARIGRDLRDGVVQDLAGVAYLLDGTGHDAVRPATRVVQEDLRRLRRTVADLSVADPAPAGLRTALADLLRPLAAAGVRCELSVSGTAGLSPESAGLLHRAARDLVRTAPAAVAVDLCGRVLTVTGVGPAAAVNLLALAVRDAGGGYDRYRGPTGETVRVTVK